MAHEPMSAASEWQSGWPVVLSSALGMTLLGVFFFSAGTFIAPLEQEFGWSRAEISSSFTVFAIIGAILSPPVGVILDKWGSRIMAVSGAALVGISFALFSTLNGSIAQWLGLWLLLAVCSQLIMVTVWTKAIANNFMTSRGLALALAMMGNGVTTVVSPLLANFLIENYGWRTAYLVLGLGWGGLVTVTSFLMLHDRPRARTTDYHSAVTQAAVSLSGYTVREGLRSAAFIKIVSSIFICNLLNIALIVHLVPILTWDGLPRNAAVWITSSLGFSMMAGTFSFGLVGDRLPAKFVTGFLVAAPAITCMMLLQPDVSVLLGAIAANIFGFVAGAQMPAFTYLAARHFGMRSFGTLQGFANTATSIATAIAPLLAGLAYDRTGGYTAFLIAGIPLVVVAGLLLLTLGRYPDFEPATA